MHKELHYHPVQSLGSTLIRHLHTLPVYHNKLQAEGISNSRVIQCAHLW